MNIRREITDIAARRIDRICLKPRRGGGWIKTRKWRRGPFSIDDRLLASDVVVLFREVHTLLVPVGAVEGNQALILGALLGLDVLLDLSILLNLSILRSPGMLLILGVLLRLGVLLSLEVSLSLGQSLSLCVLLSLEVSLGLGLLLRLGTLLSVFMILETVRNKAHLMEGSFGRSLDGLLRLRTALGTVDGLPLQTLLDNLRVQFVFLARLYTARRMAVILTRCIGLG